MSMRKANKGGESDLPTPDNKVADNDEESQTPLLGVTAPPGGIPVPKVPPHHNKAIIILRKILSICLIDNGTGSDDGGGFIGLLQDVIIGTVLAVFILSVVMWLDFVGIMHFESAHSVRNSVFKLVNDPETLENLHTSTGLTFMSSSELESLELQITRYRDLIETKQNTIEEKTKELEEKKKTLETLKGEFGPLESKLGIDKFCGTCAWKMGQTCDARLKYVTERYQISEGRVKFDIMENDPQCISA